MKRVFNNSTPSLLARLHKSTTPHGDVLILSAPRNTSEKFILSSDLQQLTKEEMANDMIQALKAAEDYKDTHNDLPEQANSFSEDDVKKNYEALSHPRIGW